MKEITRKIMALRGIEGEEDIQEFLSPRPQRTYDPLLMKGMIEGVDAIVAAINNGRHIVVYGDYDCDGVTSTVIMLTVIGAAGGNVNYYIPSRFDEGYGLNKEVIKKIKEAGADLLITVDCGSVSPKEVAYALDLGMEVVVTDHHNCDDGIAPGIVINPHQEGCSYPFKDLAGCGVAYKVALALRDKMGLPKSLTNDLLDMVALGTVADVVPLLDENRALVKYGLMTMAKMKRPGMKQLIEKTGFVGKSLRSENIAFGLGPHVNSAGRMAEASLGVRLFMAADEAEAAPLAARLVEYNGARKKVQQQTQEMCLQLKDKYIDNYLFPIIEAPGAHEGIVGIVAGHLKDQFNKPLAIVTPFGEDGLCKGSCRSVDQVDLYKLLCTQGFLFEHFGGHKKAGGFTIRQEYLEELREGLNETLALMMEENTHLLDPLQPYDLEMAPEQADVALVEDLEQMEPFGEGNRTPRFRLVGLTIDDVFYMGEEGQHVRMRLMRNGIQLQAVLFRRAKEFKDILRRGNVLDITSTLQINEWQGRRELQIVVEELELHR